VGDTLVLGIAGKYPTNYPTTPSGWTFGDVERCVSDTGAGADNGDCFVWVAYKVADAADATASASSGTVSVTHTSGNVCMGQIQRFTTTSGTVVGFTFSKGRQDTETSAATTINFSPNLSWNTDDLAVVWFGGNTDAGGYGTSGAGIAASGSSFSIVTEQSVAGSSLGDDCKLEMHRKTCTSGGGSGAGSVTFTVGGVATSTAALLVQLREVAAVTNVGDNCAGTSTATATGASTVAQPGSAAGTSTALATGTGIQPAVGGAAAGVATATASAIGFNISVGNNAAGTSTALAESNSIVDVAGLSAGTSAALSVGVGLALADGSAAGIATAAATAIAYSRSVGASAGVATAIGRRAVNYLLVGSAAGTSTAVAVAFGLFSISHREHALGGGTTGSVSHREGGAAASTGSVSHREGAGFVVSGSVSHRERT
jgi:hypothetical protein